jgi:hypothetical protein
MYHTLLLLHNALRWLFLLLAVYTILKALMGVINKTPFGPEDNKAAKFFIMVCHTQLLLGIILYFTSPVIQSYMDLGMGVAMKDKLMRLQLVEHPLTMIIGVAIIQIGKIKVRKAYEDAVKHKRSLVFYGIGLILILSRIPWGNAPLFRGMQ